jgi:rhomboid protease GluP
VGADARISLQQPGGDMQHQETAQPRGAGDCPVSVDSLAAVGKTPSPEPAKDGRQVFKVSFGQSAGVTTAPADSYRWVGAGRVEIDDNLVRIAGSRKRPFWFGKDESHEIPRAEIINVSQAGKGVRFEVHSPLGEMRFVRFVAANDAQASNIVALLPREQTPAFEAKQAELLAFHARLDRLSPRAPVTPVIVAINLAVFVAMCLGGADIINPDGKVAIQWGSDYGPLTLGGQWWRLLTSTFIHFGILHIALNMWALYQSGRTAERLFGSFRYAVLYLFAGVAGSIASLLWNPLVNGAGASGAIFGVFGGLLAFVINRRNNVPQAVMAEQRNSTLAFAAYSLFYGFVHAGIDNAAHIGGLIGGFGMGLLLARPLDEASRAKAGLGRFAGAVAAGVLVLGIVAWPLLHPSVKTMGRMQFQQVLHTFGEHEADAIKATNTLASTAKQGRVSKAAYLAELNTDVLPKWDALYNEVAMIELTPDDVSYPFQQALLSYLDSRRKALRLYGEAVDSGDDAVAEQAKAAAQDASRALEELKKLSASKH